MRFDFTRVWPIITFYLHISISCQRLVDRLIPFNRITNGSSEAYVEALEKKSPKHCLNLIDPSVAKCTEKIL